MARRPRNLNAELEYNIRRIHELEHKLEQLDKRTYVPPILPGQERTIVLNSMFTVSAVFAAGLGTALTLPTSTVGLSMKALLATSTLAFTWVAGRELRTAMRKARYNGYGED